MAEAKKTIFWVLGGCGCLTVLAAALIIGLVSAGVVAADKALEEAGLGDLAEVGEALDGLDKMRKDGSRGGDSKGGGSKELQETTRKLDKDSVDPARLARELKKPLTKNEVTNYAETIEQIQASRAYKNVVEEFEGMREVGKKKDSEKSALDTMKTAKGAMAAYGSLREVVELFNEQIEQRGGYETYYSRIAKVSGVVVAAQKHAVDGDPSSDATAKKLLELSEEKRQQFVEIDAALDAEAKNGKIDDPERARKVMKQLTVLRDPTEVALGRLPRETFEEWADLPKSLRARAIEAHSPDGKLNDFMMMTGITRGEALLVFAEHEKMKRYGELFGKGQ